MFWGFMLVCCLLIPVSMLVIGGLWRTRPPERVNGVYGYRTARSMKNRETWVFAHAYCGGLWRKMGWVLLVISAVALLPVWGKGPETIGAAAELKARYPGIQVMASREEAPYISGALKNLRLQQAERMQARLPAEQKAFGIQFCERLRKAPSVPLDGLVSGGDTFDWGGGCEIVATPGHTLGHISVRALDGAFVVTGDAAVTEGQKLAVANPEYCLDMERAQASLEKLARYHSRCYICYHGGVWEASAGDGGTSHSH